MLAEIQYKSPSAGELSRALDAGARAEVYGRAGAAMVSVLCDAPFFGGSWDDVSRVRTCLDRLSRDIPILAKDFVLDELQLDRARACGADAVLLIARIVSPARAPARALQSGAGARPRAARRGGGRGGARRGAGGGGARGRGEREGPRHAGDGCGARGARARGDPVDRVVRIHLSGIKTEDDVRAIARGPADAALVGEALMREDDPEPPRARGRG